MQQLEAVIRPETDSVCLYRLGGHPEERTVRIGNGGGAPPSYIL